MNSAQGTEMCQATQEVLGPHCSALENTLADPSRDIAKAVAAATYQEPKHPTREESQ